MGELYLLRHYPTEWNDARRIQGRTDIPLSENSIRLLTQIALPERWRRYTWVSSPLTRARQTAESLGVTEVHIVDALKEMDWGAFEGMTLSDIEEQIRARNIKPDTGQHFRPPGGESPAEVRLRLQAWLDESRTSTTVAVTHKGVIRAALSLATGWDMETPIDQNDDDMLRQNIDWLLPIKFEYNKQGKLKLSEINVHEWQFPTER